VILVVQEISTWWTKRARSGQGALRRRAAPEALPLPTEPPAGPALVHHVVACREAGDFAPETERFETRPISPRLALTAGCVRIRLLGQRVEADWAWSFECGAPARSEHRRTVLTLGPGEWGRVRTNGRMTTMLGLSDWKYHLHVVNVALAAEPAAHPFHGDPTKTFDSLADLR
jgi:hypothetical protein